MTFSKEPIGNVEFIDVRELKANDYNPNVVLNTELELLAFSILTNGWIQPILINDDVIIDGYHRYFLSINHKAMIKKYKYHAPVVRMNLTEAERMLLTIRVNRAKGNHVAVKMHEIVTKLIEKHDYTVEEICKEIGANKEEVNLLCKRNVFDALNITQHKYSKAWKPI